MKMKTPEISVVRFDEEDILTASGDTTRWSLGSFYAEYSYNLFDESGKRVAVTNSYTHPDRGDGIYNYVDGSGSNNDLGDVFFEGEFYHFDLNSVVGFDSIAEANVYWNWKTCTDESHHYLVESGK